MIKRFALISKVLPERFFIFTALPFGLLIIFLTPPFQSPDEFNHFHKAWQISEGSFSSLKHDDRVGGYVPEGVVRFAQPYYNLRFNSESRTDLDQITRSSLVSLNSDSLVFVDFPNTALYSPVVYIPQALTICVLRSFETPPLFVYYCARIITLLFWITMVYFSIRIMPSFQWLFVILALLPQSLFTNASLSADVMTNGLSFLFIGWILQRAFVAPFFSWKDTVLLAFFSFLICSSKIVYTPLLLLVFIIPASKFSSAKHRVFQSGCAFIIAGITLLVWKFASLNVYTPYSSYNASFNSGIDLIRNADINLQMEYLTQNPFAVFKVFYYSLVGNAQSFSISYIGKLGWLDTPLPWWFVVLSWALILVAIFGEKSKIFLTRSHSILLLIAFLSSFFLLVLSQYLTWSEVGAPRVYILQGRYFFPIFPLLFIVLSRFDFRRITFSQVLYPVYSILSGCFTCIIIYLRYYS